MYNSIQIQLLAMFLKVVGSFNTLTSSRLCMSKKIYLQDQEFQLTASAGYKSSIVHLVNNSREAQKLYLSEHLRF